MSLDEHEHGPITEYHGTIDLPKVISEGIRGGSPKTRSKHHVPEGLREEDLVSYTHPDREMALAFAQDRAKRLKLDPDKVGVVGVRASNLPEAVEHEEPQGGIFGGTNSFVRPGGISPEYLIQASEDKMKPKKKGIVMIISVGPKMPRKPTDESTPNKEVKKATEELMDMVRAGSIKLSGEPMDIAFQLLKAKAKFAWWEPPNILAGDKFPIPISETYDKMRQKIWSRSVQNQLNPELPPQRGEAE